MRPLVVVFAGCSELMRPPKVILPVPATCCKGFQCKSSTKTNRDPPISKGLCNQAGDLPTCRMWKCGVARRLTRQRRSWDDETRPRGSNVADAGTLLISSLSGRYN
jgi:hypothetical protein